MELAVLNSKGQDTGKKVALNEAIFGITPNEHVVYLDVKLFLANQRQGTHKSKERAEIARTTKKLKNQKGTGGARAGSMKSPLFVGGGRAFGPRPRDYGFKLNKKTKVLARKSVLSAKAQEGALLCIEDFSFDAPSTKNFVSFLNDVKVADAKTLFIVSEENKNLFLSSRNLRKSKVVSVSELTTYDVINAEKVMLSEQSLEKLNTLLAQ